MAWIGLGFTSPDPGIVLDELFDGTTLGTGDVSHFDSPVWNAALRKASLLTGQARYRAFGGLDIDLAREQAPSVAYGVDNALTLVSARTGCVIVNPFLDLAAVCVK